MLQATSRHKTDKHEAMRKEEEKVRKKVSRTFDQNWADALATMVPSRAGEVACTG